jgi:hypothetical protein
VGTRFVRTIRTASSERFLLQGAAGEDDAALELHYLPNNRVTGTLILLSSRVSDADVPNVLKQIDEVLLPDVSIEEGNLSFTVVRGTVTGSYVPVKE